MKYQNIVAAIDFSDAALPVYQSAADLAEQYQAKLTLVHVVEYMPPLEFSADPMTIPVGYLDEVELEKLAVKSLDKFTEQHAKGRNLETKILQGVPKLEIARLVDEENVDLLVIGSHGRHGLSRLLGSTVHGVMNEVGCDVMAVRLKA